MIEIDRQRQTADNSQSLKDIDIQCVIDISLLHACCSLSDQ